MDDDRLARLRATAHPLRLRILSLLTGSALSAAELARALDVSQANASYHLRRLADTGLVELVEEATIRGGRARRYQHVPGRERVDDQASSDDTRAMFAALVDELARREPLRDESGATLTADAELWVEAAAWEDVVQRVRDALLDLHDAARPPRTPGTVPTSATAALFRMAGTPDDPGTAWGDADGADDGPRDGTGS